MCQEIQTAGFPAINLLALSPSSTFPRNSEILVSTAAVRGFFGAREISTDAPVVIASFGAGSTRVEIRIVATHGPAAYRAALRKKAEETRIGAAELLLDDQVMVSGEARSQMIGGQVDARILIVVMRLAEHHPVFIEAFGNPGPNADPEIPLRYADIAVAGPGIPRNAIWDSSAMASALRSEKPPYHPTQISAAFQEHHQLITRIEFPAPSPLNLEMAAQIHPVLIAPAPGAAKSLARKMLPFFGWNQASQFSCLSSVFQRMSNWRWNADNGVGYGIALVVPASKMLNIDADYKTDAGTQISWGLGYIQYRYRSPCHAWAFLKAHGYY